MGIIALIGSVLLFAIFALVVLLALLNISSRLAMLTLFFAPFVSILIFPKTSIAFLSYQHFLLANGLVPVNNFHILLMIWSALIGIILYTEFLTWYLAKGKKEGTGNNKMDVADIQNVLNSGIATMRSKISK